MSKKIPVKKKYKDFIPKDDAGLAIWCGNYKTNFRGVVTEKKTKSIHPEEIDEQELLAQEIIDAVNGAFSQKATLAGAVAYKEQVKARNIPLIRKMAMRYKNSDAYEHAQAALLNIMYTGQPISYEEIAPDIKVKVQSGFVEVHFNKHHVLGIAVYSRTPGDADWEYLGVEITSPYLDQRPLKNPPHPERREYRAIFTFFGVHTVGQQSNIVAVVFGG